MSTYKEGTIAQSGEWENSRVERVGKLEKMSKTVGGGSRPKYGVRNVFRRYLMEINSK